MDPYLVSLKTWRRRPLFNETKYGSIQQFWFDSTKTGELIFERSQGAASVYETYQTTNGGDTWTIKEAGAKAPKLAKSPPKDSATWRVRTDAARKVHRIERRNARGGWELVASLSVRAGVCK